jgi:hypothetical protein
MKEIDVDEISDVNYENDGVEVKFKDGTTEFYTGPELPLVLAMLNHWTPPTA